VSFRRSYIDAYLPSLLPEDVGLVTAPRYYDGLIRADSTSPIACAAR
jgi:hypothetical protein